MPDKKNEIVPPDLRQLFDQADAFYEKKPWTIIDNDRDLYAVVDPRTGETSYCCVVGQNHEMTGLFAYPGQRGYRSYLKIQNSVIPPELDPDLAFEQLCLVTEFTSRDHLDAKDKRMIKDAGRKYSGEAFPRFVRFEPGFYPERPSIEETATIKDCLEVGILVAQGVEGDSGFLRHPDRVRTWRRSSNGDWTDSWEPYPSMEETIAPAEADPAPAQAIKNQKLTRHGEWDAGTIFFPGTLKSEDGRRFFPRLCVIADRESGRILTQKLIDNSEDSHLALLGLFLGVIESSRVIPRKLHLRDAATVKFFRPVTASLEVQAVETPLLQSIMEFREGLESTFSGPG